MALHLYESPHSEIFTLIFVNNSLKVIRPKLVKFGGNNLDMHPIGNITEHYRKRNETEEFNLATRESSVRSSVRFGYGKYLTVPFRSVHFGLIHH